MTPLPILLYHGDHIDKTNALYETLHTLGYDYKIIDDSALSQTLGYMMGLAGYQKNDMISEYHFPIDIMIFPSIPKEEISKISKILKEKNVDIARKAMLTQHNQEWQIHTLIDEINKEHYYFAKRLELQTLLMECMKVHPEKVPLSIRKDFQQAVVSAYDLLKKQTSIHDIEMAINQIIPLYEQVYTLII
ncbi:MAG: DUF3783 domain-containing protein [Breznakia sp.]